MFFKLAAVAAVLLAAGPSRAASLQLANPSFESPSTEFADPRVDDWQKSPKPDWFQETPEQQWDQLVGVFKNTAPGSSDHIGNTHGNQALFLFALPEVALRQESSIQFQAGRSYKLTGGFIGGGGNMTNGVTLQLSFFYRDSASNIITVAAATITNSQALFPNTTNFVDLHVSTPTVKQTDAWAGQNLGVMLLSTVSPDKIGGYWDVDNLRLESFSESIQVLNHSFESPETEFVDLRVDFWEKLPKPDWFEESPEQQWNQLIGTFKNTAPGAADHIGNIDGDQAIYLFSLPQVGLYQDFKPPVDGTNLMAIPAEFTYELGNSYRMTVGVVGGGGGMPEGATLQLALYYRDATNGFGIAASTTITNSPTLFPNITNLTDFQVELPAVRSDQPWAGKNIGILFVSTTSLDKTGGYWDLDIVRISTTVAAPVLKITRPRSELVLSWLSREGAEYRLQASPDLQTWTDIDLTIPGTGDTLTKIVPSEGTRFFRVHQLSSP